MYPLIIICGPVGVGKTVATKELLNIFPQIRTSITYTTRLARTHSVEDKKMYHVTSSEFEERLKNNEFLEWAKVHGLYYGTHRGETLAVMKDHPVIMNIDVQGAEQIMKKYPQKLVTIFLLPESHEQMIEHAKKRGDLTDEELDIRLESAKKELKKKNIFQYQIVNKEGKLHETVDELAKILRPYVQ